MDTVSHNINNQRFFTTPLPRFDNQNSQHSQNAGFRNNQRTPQFNYALLQLILRLLQGFQGAQQEPVQQEPVQQEPVQQEPVQQEPVQQEPVQQEPVQQEPVQQEPVQQEPVQQEPVQQEPVRPKELSVSPTEHDIITGLFSQNISNDVAEIVVQDTNENNGHLSTNDTVLFKDQQGNTLSTHALTESDVYDIRFRENMVDLAKGLDDGEWTFFEGGLAEINNARLRRPEVRQYYDGNSQRFSTETVIERNDFWETVLRGNRRTLVQREFDDSGNRIRNSDAINHIMSHSNEYAFDCSTPMALLSLVATMRTVGEDDFNRKDPINLSGWFDQYDRSQSDGGFNISFNRAAAGEVVIQNQKNLAGELKMFDPSSGDKLIVGSGYYFDDPGDNTSAYQGWNAIYLGRSDDNGYLFWTSDIGTQNIHFQEDRWVPTNSRFRNLYLGSYIANTDTSRLMDWDRDKSGLA